MTILRKALPSIAFWLLVALLAYRYHQRHPVPSVFAQANNTQYDCLQSGTITSATRSTIYANSFTGGQSMCSSWRIVYYTDGISGVSLQFETADQLANGTVGTWTAVPNTLCSTTVQPPCVIDGANPITTLTYGTFSINAYAPYFSLNVTTFTGSGHILYRIYGYKGLSAKKGGGSGGGGAGATGASGASGATGATGPAPPGGNVVAYTISHTQNSGDCGNWLTFNGSSLTLTLANPPVSAACSVAVQNINASALTVSGNGLTITTSTAVSSITIAQGAEYAIWTDGSNYFASAGVIGPAGATGATGPAGPTGASGAGSSTIRAVSVSTTTPATIAGTSFGILTFDTTVKDTSGGAFHSTSSNTGQFTADSSGWYRLTCSVLQGAYNGNAALGIVKNTTTAGAAFGILGYVDTSTSATQSKAWTTGAEFYLVASDFLSCSWLNGQSISNNNHTDWAVFTKLGN